MKKQTLLPSLLALAIAVTAGCGTSSNGVPKFTKVAFLSNRVVTPATSMFTSNLDGSNVSPIPFTTSSVDHLSISADGKTAVFLSGGDVWVEKTDGTGPTQLTTGTYFYWARISPSGKKVVFDNYSHIQMMNVDGTGTLDLTPALPQGMIECFEASFSADSTQVGFACYGAGNYGIYAVKVDGTGSTTVEVRANKFVDYPSFTPDGKKIVFSGSTGSGFGILSVNIDGTGETPLIASANEVVVVNSTLYYANSCPAPGQPEQLFKANLDGTNPVAITDAMSNVDLYYPSGGC